MTLLPRRILNISIFDFSVILLFSLQLSVCSPQYGPHYSGHPRHRQHHPSVRCETERQMYSDSDLSPINQEPNYPNSGPPPSNYPNSPPQSSYLNEQPNLNIFPSGENKPPPQDTILNRPKENVGIKLFPSDGEGGLNKYEPKNSDCDSDASGIDRKTGLCYKFASKSLGSGEISPCGQFMDFYQSSIDKRYGECDCKDSHLGISRPIAYFEMTDQCYWLFDQGPCNSEEWFVLNNNYIPECRNRNCPENSPEEWSSSPAESKRKYWFLHEGKCHKSDSKGYCENVDHNIYLAYKDNKYTTECKPQEINTKTLWNGIKPLPCLPGHKGSFNGECRGTASFE